ncbi:MAG TPA: hypothetical protein VFX23_08605, partial [Limnobacter sp.]|nr:hypothetical protein [Limnobacter sp.]
VTEHVVIEHGSAATMALQTVQLDQPAQWVVTDLEGAHVFMEDATHTAHAKQHATEHTTEHASLQGLVGEHSSATATPADTSSHHWGDALLGLGAAAFVAADSSGSSSSASADSTLSPAGNDATDSNSAQPAPQPAPQPDPSGGAPSNGGTSSGGNPLTDLLHLQQTPGVSSTASHNANLNDLLHSLLSQHTQA